MAKIDENWLGTNCGKQAKARRHSFKWHFFATVFEVCLN
jgi:hypothetical protein